MIFAHDHRFFKNGKNIYSPGKLGASAWGRYLSVWNSVVVIARDGGCIATTECYNLSNRDNVTFNLVDVSLFKLGLAAYRIWSAPELNGLRALMLKEKFLIARVPSLIGSVCVSLAKELGIPYALEVVGCPFDASWNHGHILGKVIAIPAAVSFKSLVEESPAALYVTREFLQRRYPCRGLVESASNVELTDYDDGVICRRIKRLNYPINRLVIGLIGNPAVKYKGVDVAIQLTKLLFCNGINCCLQVVGHGSPREMINLANSLGVGDRVEFLGGLPSGGPIFDWLDAIDIYIQPSFQEGVARAAIEAMSRGCPLFVSTAGGLPELVAEDFCHEPGDVKTLVSQLMKIINNKQIWENSILNNYSTSKRYSKNILEHRRHAFYVKSMERSANDNMSHLDLL